MNAPIEETVTTPVAHQEASPDAMQCSVSAVAEAPAGSAQCETQDSPTTWPDFSSLPPWLQQELRSDHAGEYGAVMIYRGILAISKDARIREFAEHHLVTEQKHLRLMEQIMAPAFRTRLLPIWRVMGWLTGALPALFGREAVFATIEAVETFVDRHYQQQIDRLDPDGAHGVLRDTLLACQADEIFHRDEAAALRVSRRHAILRIWCAIVGWGSAVAVIAAKRI